MMSAGLATASRSPLPCSNQMKRSMLGAYCTTWSQQKPTASLFGKMVVGSSWWNVLPPSVEYAANQFEETKTTPPPLAPLGSAVPLWPMPQSLLRRKLIAGGSPMGAFWGAVTLLVGVTGTNVPVGTVQPGGLTSPSKAGAWCGNGAPVTVPEITVVVLTVRDPGAAGGTERLAFTVKHCFW